MESTYSIHVVPDATTDGDFCYLAYHPELPGCMSHGKTVAEAIHELHAARELYLKTLDELGQPIPPKPQNPVFATWKTEAPISTKTILLADSLPKAELIPVH
jgi:predicted RNase H-like HicB family nuclease